MDVLRPSRRSPPHRAQDDGRQHRHRLQVRRGAVRRETAAERARAAEREAQRREQASHARGKVDESSRTRRCVDRGSDETEEEQTRHLLSRSPVSRRPIRRARARASPRPGAPPPRPRARARRGAPRGRRASRRRRGTKGRGLDAVEPETRARAIATPVDVAPLDVVARRREAAPRALRAAAVIDAVVAIVAIVAAVSSDEGARCFARPSAAKAKAPSTPLARDVVFPLAPTPPDRSISASVLPKMPKISLAARLREIPRFEFSRPTERLRRARDSLVTPARGAADAA